MGKALVIEGLTVSNPITTVTFDVTVESLAIDKSSLSLTAGDTATLTATVTTSDGSSVTATFESSNTSVASVSASGNTATITAVAAGSATITVRAGSKTQTCSVAIASSPTGDLATYYAANQTIASADRNALNALVTGMANAGLWAKVKRFYPILGTTKADLILEVKDNSTKGFNETSEYIATGLDVATNNLICGASQSGYFSIQDEPMQIKSNNLSIVAACKLTSDATNGEIYKCRMVGVSEMVSANLCMSYKRTSFGIGSLSIMYPSAGEAQDILERTVIWTANSTTLTTFFNGTKAATESVANSAEQTLCAPYRIFWGSEGVEYKFFMQTEYLTDSEALALNTLVETFLVATGKKSAS